MTRWDLNDAETHEPWGMPAPLPWDRARLQAYYDAHGINEDGSYREEENDGAESPANTQSEPSNRGDNLKNHYDYCAINHPESLKDQWKDKEGHSFSDKEFS